MQAGTATPGSCKRRSSRPSFRRAAAKAIALTGSPPSCQKATNKRKRGKAAAPAAAGGGKRGDSAKAASTSTPIELDDQPLTALQQKEVNRAVALEKRRAKAAAKKAAMEPERKRRCAKELLECWEARVPTLADMITSKPPIVSELVADTLPAYLPGTFVDVASDTSPNVNLQGGRGQIVEVSGSNFDTVMTVAYTLGGSEKSVPLDRVTAAARLETLSPRSRAKPVSPYVPTTTLASAASVAAAAVPPPAKLRLPARLTTAVNAGWVTVDRKGWLRAEDFPEEVGKKYLSHRARQMLARHYDVLQTHNDAVRATLAGMNITLPVSRGESGTFAKKGATNPLTRKYLNFAWGVGKNYSPKEADAVLERDQPKEAKNGVNVSVITDQNAAKVFYTPKQMYTLWQRRQQIERQLLPTTREDSTRFLRMGKERWEDLPREMKLLWGKYAKEHDVLQPGILGTIIDTLRDDPHLSFDDTAAELPHIGPPGLGMPWCSGNAIQRLFAGQETYSTYCGRVLPLLSHKQMKKHVAFARRLLSNWKKGRGKFLWINFDEKWFWGLVCRYAKKCEALGLMKESLWLVRIDKSYLLGL